MTLIPHGVKDLVQPPLPVLLAHRIGAADGAPGDEGDEEHSLRRPPGSVGKLELHLEVVDIGVGIEGGAVVLRCFPDLLLCGVTQVLPPSHTLPGHLRRLLLLPPP
jgi:hypothetical protein